MALFAPDFFRSFFLGFGATALVLGAHLFTPVL